MCLDGSAWYGMAWRGIVWIGVPHPYGVSLFGIYSSAMIFGVLFA